LAKKTAVSIVDDDESVREAMMGLMRSVGYSAIAFPSAEGFLTSRRRGATACLIVDVQMPGMTGLELHNRLIASGEPIPTILITAYPDERMRAQALNGVLCYLAKPFSESELLACIHSALRHQSENERE
jgi:FixJ family two-component response regulator